MKSVKINPLNELVEALLESKSFYFFLGVIGGQIFSSFT